MEIFTLDRATYKSGEIVQGIDSVLWVERYREAGEFTIVGDPTVNFREQLALGTIISHSNTYDMMIVENHEIDESVEGSPKLKVTGRSVEAYVMDNRVISLGWYYGYQTYPDNETIGVYLVSDQIWDHAKFMIDSYCVTSILDSDENIPNMEVIVDIVDTDPNQTNRFIETGILYPEVLGLLAGFDGGIRVIRPNDFVGDETKMTWHIHRGEELRQSVQFDWVRGEVDQARYLWSIKEIKNKQYVQSNYYGMLVEPTPVTGWDVKAGHSDFNELNDYYDGEDEEVLEAIWNMLVAKGFIDILLSYATSVLMDSSVGAENQWVYRKNYNIGDIIYVRGNYGMEQAMRVTEYAESADDTGESGYPTLTALIPGIEVG